MSCESFDSLRMKAVTVERGLPMSCTELDVSMLGTIVQCMAASVGPYIANRTPACCVDAPNSLIICGVSISPIVSKAVRPGAASLVRRRVVATVGVNSIASTSRRFSTAGRSARVFSLSHEANVAPRNQGKKISNKDTSNVGAANWKKRLNEGMCSSCARSDCVTA
ncbi:hypothetical protein ES702_07813 [subsurface metagenome]